MINVLVVDDHVIINYAIQNYFSNSKNIAIVDTAKSGKEALLKLKDLDIDVVVLDIGMPEMDGVECCARIKKKYPDKKVVVFTGETNTQLYYDIWMKNADGILLKTHGLPTLNSAIIDVYNGLSVIGKDVQSFFERVKPKGSLPKLSKREKDVLKLLGLGYTRKKVSETLFISIETVNTHCKNIFKKFNDNSINSIIAKAKEARMIK